MKRNLLKRIGAVALAVAVSLTMGTAAFADDTFDGQAYLGNDTISETGITTATFHSELVAADNTAHLPATQITYTLGNGTAVDYTDTNVTPNKVVHVYAGDASTQVSITQPSAFATSEVATATKDVVLTFDPSKFSKPGIYRYTITSGLTDAQKALGIDIASGDTTTKWLDLYVTRQSGNLVVSNAVMFKPTATPAYDSANAKLDYDTTNKVDGFKYTYTTGTVTINKQVTGTLGDQTLPFDFSTALSNTNVGELKAATAALANVSGGSITTATTWDVGAASPYAYTLKHGETLTISGLPLASVAAIAETYKNPEGYTVTYTVNGGNSTSGTEASATATNATTVPVVFTNDLSSVSPTNVVMRFAPYLFILGAAIVLLVMMRRRKSHDAE